MRKGAKILLVASKCPKYKSEIYKSEGRKNQPLRKEPAADS